MNENRQARAKVALAIHIMRKRYHQFQAQLEKKNLDNSNRSMR